MSLDASSTAMSMSALQLQHEAEDSGLEQGDIIQDAQFFQDTATEYQLAYQSLDEKYTHQVVLVKEASEALKASESHVSVLQEELMALQWDREADIRKAVGNMVSQYEHQLTTAYYSLLTLAITNRRSCSCRNRCKHSRSLWPIKEICLQWLQPKQRWISGKKYLTSFQGWSTLTRVLQSIIHLTNLSHFRNRSNLGTGLTGLIWSQILLVWVFLQQVTFHHFHQRLSTDPVRYR